MKERTRIEREWAREKYLVMVHSVLHYQKIRQLFSQPIDEKFLITFHQYVKEAKSIPPTTGSLINTYQHVWGYFKKKASRNEQEQFQKLLASVTPQHDEVRPFLQQLAEQYNQKYLLASTLLFDQPA
ncbi:YbgA family protein [Listeria ilorinensis]|uniref:YbgA family protein n=1 Tax=Listeria ilorinensis TaxID=2867439 RepID=UPI001EF6CFA7|nr:YbgA family protein [Listeria ilorinensis]